MWFALLFNIVGSRRSNIVIERIKKRNRLLPIPRLSSLVPRNTFRKLPHSGFVAYLALLVKKCFFLWRYIIVKETIVTTIICGIKSVRIKLRVWECKSIPPKLIKLKPIVIGIANQIRFLLMNHITTRGIIAQAK